MSDVVNLTPHPMHIFAPETPERIDPATVTPIAVIPPAADLPPARFAHHNQGPDDINIGVPVSRVRFGGYATGLPPATEGTWYVVSTLVAVANPDRTDLLVPYGHIRDLSGHVVGSTGFARPV